MQFQLKKFDNKNVKKRIKTVKILKSILTIEMEKNKNIFKKITSLTIFKKQKLILDFRQLDLDVYIIKLNSYIIMNI